MSGDNDTKTVREEEGKPWMSIVEEAKMQKHETAVEEMKMNLTLVRISNLLEKKRPLIFCLSFKRDWKVSIWSVFCGYNN